MLSKVLTAETAEVQPVVWRRSVPAQAKPAPAAEGQAPDEISQLQARLAETIAAAEKQSRQAFEAGQRAGEAAARKALEGETRAALDRLAATIADVAATRPEILRRAESDTVRLAIEIARRVLHRELTVDPNALAALTRAALDKLQSQEICRVRVHPAQEKQVRASLAETGRGQAIEVIADPSQPLGGILFDIARGTLDASLYTQLDEIGRGLTDQLETRL
jgi:flagellar assembly protein FliH